ncbi:MAG: sigma 54-interacting transcriptional regulator [Deltaproteobacteria bacterium]|nr:sigma 54-interacting transcriptional regulator [Deltaproteobacteria bacterium]
MQLVVKICFLLAHVKSIARSLYCLGLANLNSSAKLSANEVKAILYYLAAFRLLIVTVLLGMGFWFNVTTEQPAQYSSSLFISTIVISYIFTFLNIKALRSLKPLHLIAAAQLIFDSVLATIIIVATQSHSCLILYLVGIGAAGLIFRVKGAIVFAAFGALTYTIVGSTMLFSAENQPISTSPTDILGVYLAFIIFALISSIVEGHIARLMNLSESQQLKIFNLQSQHEQLFDDLGEGVIITDPDLVIRSTNVAARKMLKLNVSDPEYLVNRSLLNVLKQKGIDISQSSSEIDAQNTYELKIPFNDAESTNHVAYYAKQLSDPNGEINSLMFVFNDISHIKGIEERLSFHERMTQLMSQHSHDLPAMSSDQDGSLNVIGESQIIKQVFTLVRKVATADTSVLISGESGTGKELVARSIHQKSARSNKPFVAINCGAIPENLIESELFGHKKGSFTGAINDHPGLFRQANGGTVFLDEIAELPQPLQSKLLRVIQDHKVRSVGDVHEYPINVRIVSATNKDLRKEIKNGNFREDLFYRLNVINIITPPLRERREDIPLLVRYFIGKHTAPDTALPKVSPEALQALMNYRFPGNIRELENVIERALVLGAGAILPEHLPADIMITSAVNTAAKEIHEQDKTSIVVLPVNLDDILSELEKDYLCKALEHTNGAKKQAASLLGLNFRSFRYRLKKYDLQTSDDDDNATLLD